MKSRAKWGQKQHLEKYIGKVYVYVLAHVPFEIAKLNI